MVSYNQITYIGYNIIPIRWSPHLSKVIAFATYNLHIVLSGIVNHACRYFVYSWQGAIDLSRLYQQLRYLPSSNLSYSWPTLKLCHNCGMSSSWNEDSTCLFVSCSLSLILLDQLHFSTFPYSSSSNDHHTLINSPRAIALLEAINLHLLSQLKWGNMLAYCQELSVCIMSLSLVLTCLRYCQVSLVRILLNFSVLNLQSYACSACRLITLGPNLPQCS